VSRRSLLLAPAGATLALLVLAGSVLLGLQMRVAAPPAPIRAAAPLDYEGAPLGSLSPLSAAYIADVLGSIVPGGRPGSALASAGNALARTPPPVPAPVRVEVVHEFSNDDRGRALTIPSVPFTARTDTRGATREPGETAACAPAGGTVWYRYTPPADTGLIANTFGTSYSTTLGVFADSQSVGCDTDVQGNAIVQFNATKGTTYWFQVTGPTGGSLVFSLDGEGVTTLESVSSSRRPADAESECPSLDENGDMLAFASEAANLVPGDTNGAWDVFLRDRAGVATTAVSVTSAGKSGNAPSYDAYVSGTGRYVAFASDATDLVTGDANGIRDVFVRDVVDGRTELVSVSSSGKQAIADTDPRAKQPALNPNPKMGEGFGGRSGDRPFATLSWDGRYVAFGSTAPNLVPGDTNHAYDVFVHDRVLRTTERVSVDSSGREANGHSLWPSISGNGRFVSFQSLAENLADGNDNGEIDLFVHDRLTHTTDHVAVLAAVEGDDPPRYILVEPCLRQALSFDGRYLAFSASPTSTTGPLDVHIFVHDRAARRTVQVDVSSRGEGAEDNALARAPAISADGRYIAFESTADNLVTGDDNGGHDVFLHDLVTRTTILLSTAPARGDMDDVACAGACGSDFPTISMDGRVVAFRSVVHGFNAPQPTPNQIYVNERPPPAV
jgi:Tol biopolymer transport system component